MSRFPQERTHNAGGTTFKLDRRYGDLKAIGKGSYGVVVSALDSTSQTRVAIKKIAPMSAHAQDAKHVLREIRLMRYLGVHPNIVTLKNLYIQDAQDELYIVMELLDSDLHRIIQSPQNLSEAHHRYFMHQILRGVAYMHKNNVIHRDLKPGNLLVTKNCEIRITDFGLARMKASSTMNNSNGDPETIEEAMTEHVVTRWYRPPELMLCPDGMYTDAVDMWSVGCIFAELLGRRPLFPGKNFVHQLTLIFDVIGGPKQNQVSHIKSKQAKSFLNSVQGKVKVNLSTLYPSSSPSAIDLLKKLLVFEPNQRLDAFEALSHPYFDSIRANANGSKLVDPDVAVGFEFDFESQGLSRGRLKGLVCEEVKGVQRANRIGGGGGGSGKVGEGSKGLAKDAVERAGVARRKEVVALKREEERRRKREEEGERRKREEEEERAEVAKARAMLLQNAMNSRPALEAKKKRMEEEMVYSEAESPVSSDDNKDDDDEDDEEEVITPKTRHSTVRAYQSTASTSATSNANNVDNFNPPPPVPPRNTSSTSFDLQQQLQKLQQLQENFAPPRHDTNDMIRKTNAFVDFSSTSEKAIHDNDDDKADVNDDSPVSSDAESSPYSPEKVPERMPKKQQALDNVAARERSSQATRYSEQARRIAQGEVKGTHTRQTESQGSSARVGNSNRHGNRSGNMAEERYTSSSSQQRAKSAGGSTEHQDFQHIRAGLGLYGGAPVRPSQGSLGGGGGGENDKGRRVPTATAERAARAAAALHNQSRKGLLGGSSSRLGVGVGAGTGTGTGERKMRGTVPKSPNFSVLRSERRRSGGGGGVV